MRILFLPVSRRPSYLSAKRLNIGSSDGAAYAGMHALAADRADNLRRVLSI
jgi:hypothetical protein